MRRTSSRFPYRQVLIVLLVAWVVRFLVVCFWPLQARSSDSFSWVWVVKTLWAGGNPYQETPALNWPPFWMQILYLIAQASLSLHVAFIQGIRLVLATVESAVIVVLFRLIRQLAPEARPFPLLLLGIALNPVTILLICQHCNFDVFVALWVLLMVWALIRYYRSGDQVDWLLACLFLGLGVLTKTVPLLLCPLLAGGWRRVSWKAKWIGLVLALGPVTLGMSVIYVLAPEDVTAKVLGYRSAPGWFGITGLLHLAGLDNLMDTATRLFYVALAAAGFLTGMVFWKRERMEGREIVMYTAMFLAGTPALGPGYSSQYLYWFWPLLLVSYPLHDRSWRRVVIIFGVVSALTCIVEYAILPSHGQFYLYMVKPTMSPEAIERLKWWLSEPGQVLIRLPLFLAFLALLTGGVRRLVSNPQIATILK